MKRSRLVLLDANVVIYLFQLSLWEKTAAFYQLILAETVVDESRFWEADDGSQHRITIDPSRVTVFSLSPSQIDSFRSVFGSEYFERLDPGETESLAFLIDSEKDLRICSADSIVFRILGALRKGDQGISLEEILQECGLSRSSLPLHFGREFRMKWTRKGFEDGLQGRA